MGASGHVGNLNAHGWWTAVSATAVAGNTGNSKIVDIVARPVLVGTGLAIARNGTVNQLGIDGFEYLIAYPEAIHDARAKLLHHNVVVLNQLLDLFNTLGLLQVQLQGLLAATEVGKSGAEFTIKRWHYLGQIHAIRSFNSEHFRAHIGEHHGGVGSGQQGTEIQNFQVGERGCHKASPCF